MASHVRALGIAQIVYSSLGLMLGITVFALFSGAAAIVGISAPLDDSMIAVPIVAGIGWFAAAVLILLALPRFIAGIGLLRMRPWGRIVTLIVSILGLLDFPVGTALGIYGLWVLTHKDVEPMFAGGMQPAG